jgi:hypothetical protein
MPRVSGAPKEYLNRQGSSGFSASDPAAKVNLPLKKAYLCKYRQAYSFKDYITGLQVNPVEMLTNMIFCR